MASPSTPTTTNIQIPSAFFLPDVILHGSLKAMGIATLSIFTIHQCIFHTLKFRTSRNNACTTDPLKISYVITNFLVNLLLGLYGFYTCFILYEHEQGHTDNSNNSLAYSKLSPFGLPDHVFGYDQYSIFPALQVGYNLWALPMGYFFIKEPTPMIIHHISVIVICSMSATSHYGFRLHAPFLLGIFELSSVPLAVINYLTDHHEWTMKTCRGLFDASKVMFAFMFLWFRIILGSPHMYHITCASFWAWYSFGANDGANDNGGITVGTATGIGQVDVILKMWIGVVFLAQSFMAGLQYYWAYLIVLKLSRMLPGGKKSDVSKKQR